MRYVGILSYISSDVILKHAALLCDEILCDVNNEHEAVRCAIIRPQLSNIRNEVIDGLRSASDDVLDSFMTQSQQLADAGATLQAISAERDVATDSWKMTADNKRELINLLEARHRKMEIAAQDMMDRLTRLDADLLRRMLTDDILVPLLYKSHTSEGSMFAKRAAVIRVVINNLPLPAAETPWEAIVDWRSDPEANAKYRLLRAWIARLAREDWATIDIQEELAALLSTYERYMAIQHKKMRRSRFEAIVLPVAEAVESAAHFRLGRAAEKLFGLFKEELHLLEAELNAPGREVAYIADAKQRF